MKQGTPESQAIARERLSKALEHIEAAQSLIQLATERLAAIVGATSEWEATGDEYVAVKALWHDVAELRGAELDLDEMTVAAINARGGT